MKILNNKDYALLSAVLILVLSITGTLWYMLRQNSNQDIVLTNPYYTTEPAFENSIIVPIPLSIELDERKVALGDQLFHDYRLSKDDSLSCASCHDLQTGGTVHVAKAVGMNSQVGERNSPTVFNSIFNIAQYWDGRVATLEEQISGPIENPEEMGNDWPNIIRKLENDPEYIKAFSTIYHEKINSEAIIDALVTFERSLITPNSRFDRYLRGEINILTKSEIEGFEVFKSLGCSSCHQGVNIGSNLYQIFGLFIDRPTGNSNNSSVDHGRYEITGNEEDNFVFKVPTLRNIALTAPYFHNGSAATLEDAVKTMGRVQLGRNLSDDEINLIVSFLLTLTGEYKGQPL